MKAQGNKRLRILLFDDNSLVRSVLSSLLVKRGWEVLGFSAPSACPLYHSASCTCQVDEVCADAIVTDLDMPDIDGFCFVKGLLEKGCRIKNLAILSGSQDTVAWARARAFGLSVFSKAEGIPALLEWLQHIETQIQTERRLIRWAEA